METLKDESLPWNSVVVYLDAGNHFTADPRPYIDLILQDSDVALLQLKCCFEQDWSKREALQVLRADKYTIADRPQMGAYFVVVRKTPLGLRWVNDWYGF